MDNFFENIIKNKRIILWGTGNTAKTFYKKYSEKLPVYACTNNDKDIVPIENLSIIKPCDIKPETDFIIICSIYYDEIRYQLMCIDGYEQNVNFMKYSVFEELYEAEKMQKKLVVAVGQCEIREMCQVFNMLTSFKNKYSVCYFDEQKVCEHGNKYNLAETRECLEILNKADYFIKPSVLNPQSMKSFGFLQKHISEQCQTITVSLFNMDSYWAQDTLAERTLNKYYVTKNGLKLSAYVERDCVVEKFVDEGYSVKEIMDLICKEDFFAPDDVLKNHRNCIKRAQIADRISDIKMSDFVGQNYNLMKLYCDRGHFNENLLREYVKRLLEFLEENESEEELSKIEISNITQYVNELPIYPSTAKILDLQWIDRDTLYRQKLYNGIKLVTFEEYMELFIRYCQYSKEIMKYCYWQEEEMA